MYGFQDITLSLLKDVTFNQVCVAMRQLNLICPKIFYDIRYLTLKALFDLYLFLKFLTFEQ